jgi:hypothetical protein
MNRHFSNFRIFQVFPFLPGWFVIWNAEPDISIWRLSMKNLVAMMLALSFAGVGCTSAFAAETGTETVKTTTQVNKKPGVKKRHRTTVKHHKHVVKAAGNKTSTEDSTKTTTEAK